ncbi:MAG: hypothetical protein ABSA41_17845 [Terriglobia bacterium]|jgi:hypothetical protein
MFCCDLLAEASQRGAFYYGAAHRIDDGRIANDLQTEYYIRAASSRGYAYLGINYCPFCGHALSLGLWQAEKKK